MNNEDANALILAGIPTHDLVHELSGRNEIGGTFVDEGEEYLIFDSEMPERPIRRVKGKCLICFYNMGGDIDNDV